MQSCAGRVFLLVAALAWSAPGLAGDKQANPTDQDKEPSLPQLDWQKPVWCVQDATGKALRVQCELEGKTQPHCLAAPNQQKSGGDLERTSPCTWGFQDVFDRVQAQGIPIRPAVAESPPGWHRDPKGRVFQVTFDLLKRFYLGAGWTPTFALDDPDAAWDRGRFEMGFEASWLNGRARNRHTIRAAEGTVTIDQLEVAGLLFSYDLSHASSKPLLRITTFWGKPERHDLFMDLGWGLRLMAAHLHPHRSETVGLEFLELHTAWDIWQSADLYNHLRLETGIGLEGLWSTDGDELSRYAATPGATLEARFGLDQKGFHYLTGDIHWAMPIQISGDDVGRTRSRAGARAAYEVIFLAINDQPLSLRVEAGADYRDDLPQGIQRWDATMMVGMRFSFWVPARLNEELPAVANR